MNHGNFKRKSEEFFVNKKLSAKQLDALMALASDQQEILPKADNTRFKKWVASVAALVMLVLGLLLSGQPLPLPMEQKIAEEVVKNHLNQKPMEVVASDIHAIRQYFTRLDFAPMQSRLINDTKQALQGGRYCSIQGVTAAQLKFKDMQTGTVNTLYQTVYDPAVFKLLPDIAGGAVPVTVYAKGVMVDIWVEKGLLFALTRE